MTRLTDTIDLPLLQEDPAMTSRSNAHRLPFAFHVLVGAGLLTLLAVASGAHAASQYFDANGSTAGLGGAGTWTATSGGTGNWNDSTGTGPRQDWADGNDAVFNGTATYVVTQSGNFAPNSIAIGITAGNVTITGGTLTIGSPTSSFVMNTNTTGSSRAQIIASQISGTDITVVAGNGGVGINSFLTLGANPTGVTNNFTGNLIFGGPSTATQGFSQININNPTALPATATVKMQRNLSQLLFGGGGASGTGAYTATFNNNIVLNDGQPGILTQDIGSFAAGTVVTLGGVISGNANLIFQLGNGGGSGRIVLLKNETYTGFTQIATGGTAGTGATALGINDALPVGTTLSVNTGNFDLAGFNQRVAGLNSTSTGALTAISNTTGTVSTLTIDGNVTGSSAGIVGATSGARLSGSNDNVALTLAATNTGSLTLNRAAGNTYIGNTTINGGKLIAANDPSSLSSATGTGTVAVNNGGTLGGGGGVSGAITVASGGHIAPSGVFNNGTVTATNPIGAFSAFGGASLSGGSRLDIDLGAPGPSGGISDRVSLPNATGVIVPAGANTIGVNLSDPAGGAAGNGTYTIMTFQAGQYSGSNASQFFTSALPSPNSLNGATIAYHLADDLNNPQDGNPASATRVNMTVTGGPNALIWTGASSGTWDVGPPANFNNIATASSTTFSSNDNVIFDDTGANTNPITVAAGGVRPNVVTINNSATPYTFSGGDIKGSSVGGGGGLILNGTGAVTINNNYTAAGPIISNKTGAGTATFNGNITAATSLTVSGGTVTLSGVNTHTGTDTVTGGSLIVSGASATFGAGDVTVNAGNAAISAGVLNAILDSAKLTLLGGGTAGTADAGYINLGAGINERVAMLVLGGTTEPNGTYGATGSGATNIFDEYFSGTGIVTVGPAGLPGDFNSDGKVDAGDYVTWRKNNGTNNALANDNGLGTPVGVAHYNLWRANFGNPPGAGSSLGGGSAVPEPAALSLAMFALGAAFVSRRRTQQHKRT